MFDEYAKKFEELGENVPKIFKKVAKKGAINFVNEAKKITKQEGLVDTGYYRDNWGAEVIEPEKNKFGILGQNSAEYASHLEEGYDLKHNQFIPFDKMKGTPKTQNLIAQFKSKYPNAKGFIRKAGHYKGKFIGRRALYETRYYCIQQLDKEFEKAFTKYHQKFTEE